MRTIANPKTRVSLDQLYPSTFSAEHIEDTYAPLNSPSLTGSPSAPTANQSDNSNQIATTKFVKTAIANLVNGADTDLDTLKELADALGNDKNFAATMTTELGKKLNTNNANYIKSIAAVDQTNSGTKITLTKGDGSTTSFTTKNTIYTHPTTSGNKHIPSGGSSGQFLKWSSDGTAVWAADNDTHYKALLVLAGTNNATSNATSATANTATYLNTIENGAKSGSIKITGGGATSVSAINGTITITSTNTTYSAFAGKGAGLVPARSGTATTRYLREDGTWVAPPDTNTTYSVFKGSSAGLVPSRSGSATTRYLREDGNWATPPDTNTVYTHPTTAGNKHIPSGGSSGNYLVYGGSSGTASWSSAIPVASKLETARTIAVETWSGSVRYGRNPSTNRYEYYMTHTRLATGSAPFNGTENITIQVGCASGCASTCGTSCTNTCTATCSGGCSDYCSGCSGGCSGDE